ncbi:Myotubularin-associated protein [Nesidiocoris tenuis]|uniref:Myotubularin-associated protein n=1 Tax=Nesidiocoris tenuis TaxID=355587 RepID=A0ABN7AC03_9HEMI|nr:Myotubularin-associated protein [Nesidiocoris tenuis]
MADKRMSSSFKSYLGIDDDILNSSYDDSFSEHFPPKLLRGERIITEAHQVLLFAQCSERKQGKSGVLYVTNFKLSFITADEKDKEEVSFEDSTQLGENDVCLSNVDALYLFGNEKKKRLVPDKSFNEKVKGLYVVCKNMRVLSFSFKFSPRGEGKNLANVLLHHAFPKRHHLLFAYDFREEPIVMRSGTNMFQEAGDWGIELARTGCQGWRLSGANHNFQMSPNLPKWLVVPLKVLDCQLQTASRHFCSGRPPLWCWSSPNGASLVRMADLMPTITDRVQENIMLESVRTSHPKRKQPIIVDLTKDMPSFRDVQVSYCKLRELCTPEDLKQFWTQDQHFLTHLENSKWLLYVSNSLTKSLVAAKWLYDDYTVVLQESNGRDMTSVVACITQILLDPYYRTIIGFQSLVQREWVIMGHPFCSRLSHVYSNDNLEAPVFLLFLDCVWQLLVQFPTDFQFTETYLTVLWDCSLVSIYDTFLFDCERDRQFSSKDPNTPLVLRNVWDELLSDSNASLFFSPFYQPPASLKITSLNYLPVQCQISCLSVWQQCYLRHLPILEIKGGGNPQIDLLARVLASQSEDSANLANDSITLESLSKVGSFYPFSPCFSPSSANPPSALLLSTLSLNTSFHSTEIMLDSQSILNAPD